MSLAPVSRSRLHEVVLLICVLGCIANGLRERAPRPPSPVEDATDATADAVGVRIATEDPLPEAR